MAEGCPENILKSVHITDSGKNICKFRSCKEPILENISKMDSESENMDSFMYVFHNKQSKE